MAMAQAWFATATSAIAPSNVSSPKNLLGRLLPRVFDAREPILELCNGKRLPETSNAAKGLGCCP